MKFKDKEFKLVFSLNSLCKLEELGLDIYNKGLGRVSASILKNLLIAGLIDNHTQAEIDSLLGEILLKDLRDIEPEINKELLRCLGVE